MARLARLVLPGIPHHVTQRGNGRQQTLFEEGSYALYRDLFAQAAERALAPGKRGPKRVERLSALSPEFRHW